MVNTLKSLKLRGEEVYEFAREQWRKIFVRENLQLFEKTLPVHREIEAKVKLKVKLASKSDVSKLTERFGGRGKMEALERGHLCFIAEIGGEIVHYKWVTFDEVYVSELKRKMHLDSNSAYIYAVYTVPRFRGLGIDPKVTTEVFDYLYEKGVEKVNILVRSSNFPSLRVVKKVGYRKMGEISFLQVLSYKKHAYKGSTETYHSKMRELFSLQQSD